MKKNKILNLSLLITLMTMKIYSQDLIKTYVIIEFKDEFKFSIEKYRKFYWIIDSDDLNKKESILYLGITSDQNLNKCLKKEVMNPNIFFKDDTSRSEDEQFDRMDKLMEIIKQYKIKIQTIIKKWASSGQREKITIYATAIKGNFCFSELLRIQKDDFEGKVALPVSNISAYDEFWKSSKAKYFFNTDFSKIDFDIFYQD